MSDAKLEAPQTVDETEINRLASALSSLSENSSGSALSTSILLTTSTSQTSSTSTMFVPTFEPISSFTPRLPSTFTPFTSGSTVSSVSSSSTSSVSSVSASSSVSTSSSTFVSTTDDGSKRRRVMTNPRPNVIFRLQNSQESIVVRMEYLSNIFDAWKVYYENRKNNQTLSEEEKIKDVYQTLPTEIFLGMKFIQTPAKIYSYIEVRAALLLAKNWRLRSQMIQSIIQNYIRVYMEWTGQQQMIKKMIEDEIPCIMEDKDVSAVSCTYVNGGSRSFRNLADMIVTILKQSMEIIQLIPANEKSLYLDFRSKIALYYFNFKTLIANKSDKVRDYYEMKINDFLTDMSPGGFNYSWMFSCLLAKYVNSSICEKVDGKFIFKI